MNDFPNWFKVLSGAVSIGMVSLVLKWFKEWHEAKKAKAERELAELRLKAAKDQHGKYESDAELDVLSYRVREQCQEAQLELKVSHPQWSDANIAGLLGGDIQKAKRVLYHLEKQGHARKNPFGNWDID